MKFNKKILGILAVVMVAILCLVGCNNTSTGSNTGSNNETVFSETTNKEVVAVLNGKEIKREDVGQTLIDAEKTAIQDYLYEVLKDEFYSDIEVTEKELEEALNNYKKNVGEDNWEIYLMLYGGGTEEAFKEMLKEEILLEEKVNEKTANMTITDEDLQKKYDENPNSYNIAVMDAIFLGEEQLAEATRLYEVGATLKDISAALNVEISEDEHCYFESDIKWTKDISTQKVGDMNITTSDSQNYIVGTIVELNVGISNAKVKEDLLYIVKQEKGLEEVNNDWHEFLKKSSATVFGEEFALYEEPTLDETAVGDVVEE